MKNILIAISMLLFMTGCTLERLPLNGPSKDSFPANEDEALSGVYAAYKAIAENTTNFEASWWRAVDVVSDIAVPRVNTNPNYLMNSTATSQHLWVDRLYKKMYTAIGRINLVLDNLYKIEGTANPENLAIMRAELLTMRAFCYDLLVQHYGAVPYIEHSIGLENMSHPRMPKDEIVAKLLTELSDEVLDVLPVRWDSSYGTARIGRVAAYMIKARIYMNYATAENGYYEQAAVYSKKALELAEAGGHNLSTYDLTYYATATDGEPNCKLFSYEGENDSEWIWAMQYDKLIDDMWTVNIYYVAPRTLNGAAWMGPSQFFIDTFQCKDGLSIAESPLYDWKNPWANRDPRLDLFCVRSDSRVMGVEHSINITKENVMNYHTGSTMLNADVAGNKSEYGVNGTKGPGGYLWRKGYDNAFYGNIMGASKSQTQDDINVGVLRLAELLLIDAEVNIESPTGDLARAKANIDRIRARAGMPEIPAADMTQEGLRKALRYERMVELCNEGLRWYDLRRWNIAPKAVNRNFMAPGHSTKSSPNNYISNAKPQIDEDWIVTYDGTTWDGAASNLRIYYNYIFKEGKDELWPIPKSEMDSNSAITEQNPGY